MSSTVVVGGLGGPRQQIEVEVATDHRRDRKDPLGVLSESPDPHADHLAHAVGQRDPFERCPAATHRPFASWTMAPVSVRVAQDLADEERVAVGLAIHGVGETDRGVVERVTGGRLHQGDDTGVIEPGQLDARDAVLAMQRRQASRATDATRDNSLSRYVAEHQDPQRLVVAVT